MEKTKIMTAIAIAICMLIPAFAMAQVDTAEGTTLPSPGEILKNEVDLEKKALEQKHKDIKGDLQKNKDEIVQTLEGKKKDIKKGIQKSKEDTSQALKDKEQKIKTDILRHQNTPTPDK